MYGYNSKNLCQEISRLALASDVLALGHQFYIFRDTLQGASGFIKALA
jgi:hypothetical protein